ncbi:MAG: hypothetical protein LR015_13425 [Verrucomicrobia bacterium]|nr:hypothetical protein [Verrucomicrobiota bacterium]
MSAKTSSTPRALIFQKDPVRRRALSLILAECGFSTLSVEEFEQQQELLNQQSFNLLITDAAPGKKRALYATKLRTSDRLTPMAMVAGSLDLEDIIEALRAGVFDVHESSVDVAGFVARLQKRVSIPLPDAQLQRFSSEKFWDNLVERLASLESSELSIEAPARTEAAGVSEAELEAARNQLAELQAELTEQEGTLQSAVRN